MKKIFKKLALFTLGDYQVFKIYFLDLKSFSPPEGFSENLQHHRNDNKSTQGFSGPQSHNFRYMDDQIQTALSQCWYWYGERYKERNYWPLQEGEAKLIDIKTHEKARGMGLAPELIIYSAYKMKQMGFRKLYARIWHSNAPSLRAFSKAGWKPLYLVIDIFPFGIRIRLKVPIRA